jgi:mRNA-degrading endonuclease RelE of RelBE toxin-antitoxin system
MNNSDEVVVLIMPAFKQRYKKLHQNQKTPVNEAIEAIKANPLAGNQKKGDLAMVHVYKFDCVGQEFLLAYEFDPKTRVLLALGVHENFYRDLKQSGIK